MILTHLMDIELSKLDIFVLIVNDDWNIVPDIVLLYEIGTTKSHERAAMKTVLYCFWRLGILGKLRRNGVQCCLVV